MFLAVGLFALLLIGVLIIAFFRFQEQPAGPPGPATGYQLPATSPEWQLATGNW